MTEPLPGFKASIEHCLHCFDALVHSLTDKGVQPIPHPPFEDVSCPLFVTWNKAQAPRGSLRLRGCIGTLEPRRLHTAVRDYALTSALRDRRFDPVTMLELPHLHCTVSLLHSFEEAAAWDDWKVGVHGIIVAFTDPASGARRSSTFLPEVARAERWDRGATLDAAVRKAGCSGAATVGGIARAALRVTRYQSTTCTLGYDEYARMRSLRSEPRTRRGWLATLPA